MTSEKLDALAPRRARRPHRGRRHAAPTGGDPVSGASISATAATAQDARVRLTVPSDDVNDRRARVRAARRGARRARRLSRSPRLHHRRRPAGRPLRNLRDDVTPPRRRRPLRRGREHFGIAEPDAVADALNDSAARIETLVEAEREFSANASHQLRTPLTALRHAPRGARDDRRGPARPGAEVDAALDAGRPSRRDDHRAPRRSPGGAAGPDGGRRRRRADPLAYRRLARTVPRRRAAPRRRREARLHRARLPGRGRPGARRPARQRSAPRPGNRHRRRAPGRRRPRARSRQGRGPRHRPRRRTVDLRAPRLAARGHRRRACPGPHVDRGRGRPPRAGHPAARPPSRSCSGDGPGPPGRPSAGRAALARAPWRGQTAGARA